MRLRTFFLHLLLTIIGTTTTFAQVQKGKATYYSKKSTGARTASGERLHHDSLTCAHRNYPFGTLLKVTNIVNDQSVIVRVTDRGPYRRGAIIDLSYRAAKEIGMLNSGVQTVKVEVVDELPVPFRPKENIVIPAFEVAEAEPAFMEEWEERLKANKDKNTQNKQVAHNPKKTHPQHEQGQKKPGTPAVSPFKPNLKADQSKSAPAKSKVEQKTEQEQSRIAEFFHKLME